MKFHCFTGALTGAILSITFSARAELKLPAIFRDNLVLQQQQTVPVWGWAAPGAKVTVKFSGQTKATHAADDGKWLVNLDKLKASFIPQTLVITSGETRTLTNILVGEVWIGSGQSNMEKPIGEQRGQQPTFNAEAELAAASYPNLRLFLVEKAVSIKPLADLQKFKGWEPCSSNALVGMHFSAAAYFFGREIHTNLNVPVGVIVSSWGGTRVEPWTPPAGFEKIPSLVDLAGTPNPGTNKNLSRLPMTLYNAMIAPIAGYGIRGAIWYQGESNRGDTNYDTKMAALVGGWRAAWNEGDFPFYFVQIAPFKYIKDMTVYSTDADPLPPFWLQQSRAARQIKNAGMIVTTDLVDDLNDIHPRNKKDIGHRLALLALDKTYGKKVSSSGPAFWTAKFVGGKAILSFTCTDGGLVSKDGRPLTWFEIAGMDGKFVAAEAKIAGDTVEVFSPAVTRPAVVRFAWNQIAQPNLFNGSGLPAEPFRTDEPAR